MAFPIRQSVPPSFRVRLRGIVADNPVRFAPNRCLAGCITNTPSRLPALDRVFCGPQRSCFETNRCVAGRVGVKRLARRIESPRPGDSGSGRPNLRLLLRRSPADPIISRRGRATRPEDKPVAQVRSNVRFSVREHPGLASSILRVRADRDAVCVRTIDGDPFQVRRTELPGAR